jgi:hypothetical protein
MLYREYHSCHEIQTGIHPPVALAGGSPGGPGIHYRPCPWISCGCCSYRPQGPHQTTEISLTNYYANQASGWYRTTDQHPSPQGPQALLHWAVLLLLEKTGPLTLGNRGSSRSGAVAVLNQPPLPCPSDYLFPSQTYFFWQPPDRPHPP